MLAKLSFSLLVIVGVPVNNFQSCRDDFLSSLV